MKLPKQNEKLTQDQVELAINLTDFPGAVPGSKGWHEGLWEHWTIAFGYPEGKAMYASVAVDGQEFHIYFLNDNHQRPIILKRGETPATYGVAPEH